MSEVRSFCFLNWIEIPIYDFIEVSGANSSDVDELVTLEGKGLTVYECGKGKRSKVADCYLVRRGVFDDFSAEVAGFDGSEVLLV